MKQLFGNWINRHDLAWIATRLPRRFGRTLQHILRPGRKRTIAHFTIPSGDDQWWCVPSIVQRWNRLISGSHTLDHYDYIASKYLQQGDLTALSVGCGSGMREIRWAKTGRFRRITGIDITPATIASAISNAEQHGVSACVEFRVADLSDRRTLGAQSYDLLLGEHSLHHFSPLRTILANLSTHLISGGLFVFDEFVGPRCFQWSEQQIHHATRLLREIPERLRRQHDCKIKTNVYRPSKLYMRLTDPSEAAESDQIIPLMDELFERIELRPYGGALLHILLSSIAHNFSGTDAEAAAYLARMMAEEDRLMRGGELPSDFAVGVYRKR